VAAVAVKAQGRLMRPPMRPIQFQAAIKIQSNFRGMKARSKMRDEMNALQHEGKILAEISNAMVWKMV
jgi:hypothetical protein